MWEFAVIFRLIDVFWKFSRYTRDMQFTQGLWVGLQLDTPEGRNNGKVGIMAFVSVFEVDFMTAPALLVQIQGVEYFRCKNKHGILIKFVSCCFLFDCQSLKSGPTSGSSEASGGRVGHRRGRAKTILKRRERARHIESSVSAMVMYQRWELFGWEGGGISFGQMDVRMVESVETGAERAISPCASQQATGEEHQAKEKGQDKQKPRQGRPENPQTGNAPDTLRPCLLSLFACHHYDHPVTTMVTLPPPCSPVHSVTDAPHPSQRAAETAPR